MSVRHFDTLKDELEFVAREVGQVSPPDRKKIAIFSGSHLLLREMAEALKANKIPYGFPAKFSQFDSPPFQMIYSIIALTLRKRDRGALVSLASAFYELLDVPTDIRHVVFRSLATGEGYLRIWLNDAYECDHLPETTRELLLAKAEAFLDDQDVTTLIANVTAWAEMPHVMPYSSPRAKREFRSDYELFRKLFADLRGFRMAEAVTSEELLAAMDESMVPERPPDSPILLNMRFARDKGFDRAYIIGFVDDIVPGVGAIKEGEDSYRMSEARGLVFSVLTRVERSVMLTCCESMAGLMVKPSRFLSEMNLVF